ncbi:MAG: hypothetical protein EHM89_18720 [Acidobacteria bacterium]|nr:MAG: hypothetical protein EHM89_18720 [Acidobacteriota bacterium]
MNEFIEVRFQKNDKRLRVKRQRPGGIEFDEHDPLERTVGIEFGARDEITRVRMDSIRRIQGWQPGEFKLKMSGEGGSIVLRGANEHALPDVRYKIRLQIEEAKTPRAQMATVDHDGSALVTIDVEMDDRTVNVDLTAADATILALLERSRVDGAAGSEWVADTARRPTRQACLLNLIASLRTRPTMAAPLLKLVERIFFVANDRMYAKVDRRMVDVLQDLADDPDRPFFAEGTPHAAIHGRLLTEMPEPPEVRARFTDLFSFRAEGKPSMQVVVAVPPADLAHSYAEFDLDLGNPLQDVVGFFVHIGELLDGKPTNHLDMRKSLAQTNAGRFLYYTVVSAG